MNLDSGPILKHSLIENLSHRLLAERLSSIIDAGFDRLTNTIEITYLQPGRFARESVTCRALPATFALPVWKTTRLFIKPHLPQHATSGALTC